MAWMTSSSRATRSRIRSRAYAVKTIGLAAVTIRLRTTASVPCNITRRRTPAMDHTVVHFEIPADDPERAAKFYRELFGWEISKWGGPVGGGEGPEYWMVRTVPTDAAGQPTRPGVNGGLMRRMMPGQTPRHYNGVAGGHEGGRGAGGAPGAA